MQDDLSLHFYVVHFLRTYGKIHPDIYEKCFRENSCALCGYSRPWSRVEAYVELTAVCAFGAHKQRTQNNLCRPTVCAKIQLLYFWTVCCFIENVHARYNTYCIFPIMTFLSYSRLND